MREVQAPFEYPLLSATLRERAPQVPEKDGLLYPLVLVHTRRVHIVSFVSTTRSISISSVLPP